MMLAVQASAGTIGCSWCIDFGYYEGLQRGVDPAKVRDVANWRDSDVYDDRERAVLEYAESASRHPGHGERGAGGAAARRCSPMPRSWSWRRGSPSRTTDPASTPVSGCAARASPTAAGCPSRPPEQPGGRSGHRPDLSENVFASGGPHRTKLEARQRRRARKECIGVNTRQQETYAGGLGRLAGLVLRPPPVGRHRLDRHRGCRDRPVPRHRQRLQRQLRLGQLGVAAGPEPAGAAVPRPGRRQRRRRHPHLGFRSKTRPMRPPSIALLAALRPLPNVSGVRSPLAPGASPTGVGRRAHRLRRHPVRQARPRT